MSDLEKKELLKSKIINLIKEEYPKPIRAYEIPILLKEIEGYFSELPLVLN